MTENEYYDESIRRIEKNIDCFVNRLSAKSLNNCETILNTMRDDVRNAAEAKSDSMYKYISDDKAVSFEYNVDLINCEKVMAEIKVKKDNEKYFLQKEPTKLYYTGKNKTFPSTIALNKLYYFMPYLKEKGVRDLYLIRVLRIGNKAEIHPESKDEEPRLVFELEYLESLQDYQKVQIYRYWYKDTLLGRIIEK